LDNDLAGRLATEAIMAVLPKQYTAINEPPPAGKDYNDYLCDSLKLPRTAIKERSCAR
jgi:DNA primase